MTSNQQSEPLPALEQLLAEGKVAGALILKGDFTAEERDRLRQVYAIGVEHGRAGLEEQLETARREREQTRDLYSDAIRQRDEWKERCHALTDAALEQRRFGWQESQTMTALLDSELSHVSAETPLPSRDPN